jgi:hypothetical protein
LSSLGDRRLRVGSIAGGGERQGEREDEMVETHSKPPSGGDAAITKLSDELA